MNAFNKLVPNILMYQLLLHNKHTCYLTFLAQKEYILMLRQFHLEFLLHNFRSHTTYPLYILIFLLMFPETLSYLLLNGSFFYDVHPLGHINFAEFLLITVVAFFPSPQKKRILSPQYPDERGQLAHFQYPLVQFLVERGSLSFHFR